MKPSVFLLIHSIFITAGWLFSMLLDRVVFELSHDYVFPPGFFQRRALSLSWMAAAVVCLTVNFWNCSPKSPRRMFWSTLISLGILTTTTVTVASIPLAIKQLGFERFLSVPALTRRHLFCQMLPLAACIGAFASSVAFSAALKSLAKQPALKDCKQNSGVEMPARS